MRSAFGKVAIFLIVQAIFPGFFALSGLANHRVACDWFLSLALFICAALVLLARRSRPVLRWRAASNFICFEAPAASPDALCISARVMRASHAISTDREEIGALHAPHH